MDLGQDRDRDLLENELNRGALWAITYGDLMSYLMIFFLILFSVSMSEEGLSFVESLSEVQKSFGGEENRELVERKTRTIKEEQVAKEIQAKFDAREGLEKLAHIELSEERLKVTLREAVVFSPGEVELKASARAVLREVAEAIRGLPNLIQIEGHSDNSPVPKGSKLVSNWVISMARAYKVLRYFSDEEGIAPERLACVGYGQYKPIADNGNPEGRAQNRRIEISLVRTK